MPAAEAGVRTGRRSSSPAAKRRFSAFRRRAAHPRNGTLIYQTVNRPRTSQLTWFDRSGKMLGTVGGPGSYQVFSLSPDQKSVAVSFARNIWSFDLVRGVNTRLTFGNDYDFSPIW